MTNDIKDQAIDRAVGTLIGLACGDSLGWANEMPSKNAAGMQVRRDSRFSFVSWDRISGSRYHQYVERINAGEYSDDTQLTICIARALLAGSDWPFIWSRIELPIWTCYERGGGGATKRAADLWINGTEPWKSNQADAQRYFDAGGNGVAMRVAPHAIFHMQSPSFQDLRTSIISDAVVTHGHPRAVIGALCLGYAIWVCLKRSTELVYGSLLELVIAGSSEWGRVSENELPPSWMDCQHKVVGKSGEPWGDVATEMINLLKECQREIDLGALASDEKILHSIGAISSRQSGSGTIGAASAIYLASRYAASPSIGLTTAARMSGLDTDTVAAMTGALLGAINGSDWLAPLVNAVQDEKLLARLASDLVFRNANARVYSRDLVPITRSGLKEFVESCMTASIGEKIRMPHGETVIVSDSSSTVSKTGAFSVSVRKISRSDGQSAYIHRIKKNSIRDRTTASGQKTIFEDSGADRSLLSLGSSIGVRLSTTSISVSERFYSGLLGVRVKRRSETSLYLDGGIVLRLISTSSVNTRDTASLVTICVEVGEWERRYDAVRSYGHHVLQKPATWGNKPGGQRYFRCLDPDGYVVEVFEKI